MSGASRHRCFNAANVAAGKATRADLATRILPLAPGALVPELDGIAAQYGFSRARACKHRWRVLVEAGVRVERRGRRLVVVGVDHAD